MQSFQTNLHQQRGLSKCSRSQRDLSSQNFQIAQFPLLASLQLLSAFASAASPSGNAPAPKRFPVLGAPDDWFDPPNMLAPVFGVPEELFVLKKLISVELEQRNLVGARRSRELGANG